MSREAMRMALEALELYLTMDTVEESHLLEVDIAPKAITALRAALAEPEPRNQCGETCEGEEHMNPQPKALVLADALEELDRQFSRNGLCGDAAAELRRLHEVNQDLLEALHEALETEQEPVAWRYKYPDGFWRFSNGERVNGSDSIKSQALYTAPPKREWVGLTDEEIDALSQAPSLTDELMDCVDRLGSEADTVDPRVWQHLLVYAPKPEEEPVAWITNGGKGELWWHRSSKFDEEGNLIGPNPDDIPLYTAPLKKEWVGLTDKEVQDLGYLSEKFDASNSEWFDRWGFARAIEQSLREKNHG